MANLSILLSLIISLAYCELRFVTELFRHGARNKIFGAKKEESGELTAVG